MNDTAWNEFRFPPIPHIEERVEELRQWGLSAPPGTERLIALDREGKIVMDEQGEEGAGSASVNLGPRKRELFLIHNHPHVAELSNGDFLSAVRTAGILAVSPDGTISWSSGIDTGRSYASWLLREHEILDPLFQKYGPDPELWTIKEVFIANHTFIEHMKEFYKDYFVRFGPVAQQYLREA